MSYGRFILDAEGQPVPCVDLVQWAQWMETAERHIGDDRIGETRVSTVFLGLDHSFSLHGTPSRPILFETMVFGGPLNQEMERYSSREEALQGHAVMVQRAKEAQAMLKLVAKWEGKCPKHPKFNPRIQLASEIKGGCVTCQQLVDLYAEVVAFVRPTGGKLEKAQR